MFWFVVRLQLCSNSGVKNQEIVGLDDVFFCCEKKSIDFPILSIEVHKNMCEICVLKIDCCIYKQLCLKERKNYLRFNNIS